MKCDYQTEPLESELLRLNNVVVRSADGVSGKFWIKDASSTDSIRIDDDLWFYGTDKPNPIPNTGFIYDYVIGVAKYEGREDGTNHRGWIILPRFAADYHQSVIVPPTVTAAWSMNPTTLVATFDRKMDPITAGIPSNYTTVHGLAISGAVLDASYTKVTLTTGIQPDNFVDSLIVMGVCDSAGTNCITTPYYRRYHSGITPISVVQTPNPRGDSSIWVNDVVTVKAVITSDSTTSQASNEYMSDQSGPPYRGIHGYFGAVPGYHPFIGDTIIATGIVAEYFQETELSNISTYGNMQFLHSGPAPTPFQVTTSQLLAHGEYYESDLVTDCDSFVVTNTALDAYGWVIHSLTTPAESLVVDKNGLWTRYTYVPILGDHITGITGIYKFDRSLFRISPRTNADFNSYATWCGAPQPGSIAGAVTDPSAVPIEGVIDSVFAVNNDLMGIDTTDNTGSYSFTLDAGTYHVKFVKDGFRDTTINDIAVLAGQQTIVNVQMSPANPPTGTINGMVTDLGSVPLNGVTDSLFASDNSFVGVTNTNSSGIYFFITNPGTYHIKYTFDGYRDTTIDNIVVVSNQTVTVNVQMTPLPLPGCIYIPGDINGNGSVNGVDIVFAVNYFKGGPNHPPVDCYSFCPLTPNPFFAAGDVNGNCAFNGVDITYFVRFLKLQVPSLLNCADCPPAPPFAPAVMPKLIHQATTLSGQSQ